MSDSISRKVAIEVASRECHELRGIFSHIEYGLKELPSAEPERKKGKWQLCGNHHLCSECDEWALTVWDDNEYEEVDVLTNFCPYCGCQMSGGEQDE